MSKPRRFQTSAVAELVFASMLWGFGFIATMWVLPVLGPVAITGMRMFYAFIAGIVICTVVPTLRRQLSWSQFWLAFWPGLFLCATMLLQTWGLRFTTVTKSGFITTLYVLIVPLMERVLLGRRIPKYHMIYVGIALIGMAMICDVTHAFDPAVLGGDPRAAWNIGDWITLACAFAASLQIVWFGKIQTQIQSSFVFNTFQTFWTGVFPFALMFFISDVSLRLSGWPLIGLIELVFGSTMIAFSLQVRAQKKISPSVSSLVFLLESPFAALFSFFILGERPTVQALIGAAIILVALVSSVVFSHEGTSEPTQ